MVMFDSNWSSAAPPPEPTLSQRARAGLEILGSIQVFTSTRVRDQAKGDFYADPDGERLNGLHPAKVNEPWPEFIARAREVADRSQAHRIEQFFQRYVAEEVWNRAIPAMEEHRERFERFFDPPAISAGGTVELDPHLELPEYFERSEVHLEPGGWDGYDLYGPAFAHGIGPKVFRHGGLAAVAAGEDIYQHRLDMIEALPKARYERIYDAGCGAFSLLKAAAEIHPEAELVGADLSPNQLRVGHQMAEKAGVKVHFKQRDVRDTREPDNSFDAVVMHAVMHEMPVEVSIATFKEMFRILKPGGDIMISDPPAFSACSLFNAVLMDWESDNRGEPFFTAALSQDWPEELRKIGFVNTETRIIGKHEHPYITLASKPL